MLAFCGLLFQQFSHFTRLWVPTQSQGGRNMLYVTTTPAVLGKKCQPFTSTIRLSYQYKDDPTVYNLTQLALICLGKRQQLYFSCSNFGDHLTTKCPLDLYGEPYALTLSILWTDETIQEDVDPLLSIIFVSLIIVLSFLGVYLVGVYIMNSKSEGTYRVAITNYTDKTA